MFVYAAYTLKISAKVAIRDRKKIQYSALFITEVKIF